MKKRPAKFGRLISSVRTYTSVLDAFKDGATPTEIKQSVIELLAPYLANREQLETLAIDALSPEAAEVARLSGDTWTLELFKYCLHIHQDAKLADPELCMRACMDWLPPIYDGLSVFWSMFHLEIDKSDLDSEEFLHECLRNIGALVEAAIKPACKELVQQLHVSRGQKPITQDVSILSLGQVIKMLIDASPNQSYFAPWGVPLNQWRNIAQHYSARFEQSVIVLWYGPASRLTTLRLTRSELIAVVSRVRDIFACMRLAFELFAVDNMSRLLSMGFDAQNLSVRPEMGIMHLVTGLATQGFEVVDLQISEEIAALTIRDVSPMNSDQRRLHIPQFAAVLWHFTGAALVTVEYLELDGSPNLRASASKELFERAERENLSKSDVAAEVDLLDLKNGRVIPKVSRLNLAG